MRPGLVVVGIAFLVVASASGASLYLWPSTPSTQDITTEVPSTLSSPNQTREALLSGTSEPSGTFSVTWQSSAAFDVSLYDAPGCTSASLACATAPAVAHWPANTSGRWSTHGTLAFPYLLVWTAEGPSVASLQATAESSADVSTAPPAWATIATVGAIASLGVIGGIALFLGLFLRGGVFRKALDGPGVTGPRTDSPDDADGPPRRGPPSPGR